MNRGEIVQLGPHRLMCGDAFSEDDCAALLQDEKPDMLYCDPPYGMRLDTDFSSMESRLAGLPRTGNHYEKVIADDKPFDPAPLLGRFAATKEQFWWGADYYADAIPNRLDGSWMVWDKRLTESMSRIFGSCFEMAWSRQRHKREVIRLLWSGLFGLHIEPERRRLHPTQKPIALAEWFLERYSKPDGIILDLFGGSGSTLLACERMGRVCRMMEISPDYCDVIVQRYEALTKQPRLIA